MSSSENTFPAVGPLESSLESVLISGKRASPLTNGSHMTDGRIESDDIEQLYKDQNRELWALFYAHCSDPERAYDALQESFLRLQAHTGEPIRDTRAWLLRVGRNWLRDIARRKSSSTRLSDKLDEQSSTPIEPAGLMEGQELRVEVRKALRELKAEDREVLVLRYALGWSSNRIAITLDSSSAAVDMRLSRARRRLAVILEEAGVGHEV